MWIETSVGVTFGRGRKVLNSKAGLFFMPRVIRRRELGDSYLQSCLLRCASWYMAEMHSHIAVPSFSLSFKDRQFDGFAEYWYSFLEAEYSNTRTREY